MTPGSRHRCCDSRGIEVRVTAAFVASLRMLLSRTQSCCDETSAFELPLPSLTMTTTDRVRLGGVSTTSWRTSGPARGAPRRGALRLVGPDSESLVRAHGETMPRGFVMAATSTSSTRSTARSACRTGRRPRQWNLPRLRHVRTATPSPAGAPRSAATAQQRSSCGACLRQLVLAEWRCRSIWISREDRP